MSLTTVILDRHLSRFCSVVYSTVPQHIPLCQAEVSNLKEHDRHMEVSLAVVDPDGYWHKEVLSSQCLSPLQHARLVRVRHLDAISISSLLQHRKTYPVLFSQFVIVYLYLTVVCIEACTQIL